MSERSRFVEGMSGALGLSTGCVIALTVVLGLLLLGCVGSCLMFGLIGAIGSAGR